MSLPLRHPRIESSDVELLTYLADIAEEFALMNGLSDPDGVGLGIAETLRTMAVGMVVESVAQVEPAAKKSNVLQFQAES